MTFTDAQAPMRLRFRRISDPALNKPKIQITLQHPPGNYRKQSARQARRSMLEQSDSCASWGKGKIATFG